MVAQLTYHTNRVEVNGYTATGEPVYRYIPTGDSQTLPLIDTTRQRYRANGQEEPAVQEAARPTAPLNPAANVFTPTPTPSNETQVTPHQPTLPRSLVMTRTAGLPRVLEVQSPAQTPDTPPDTPTMSALREEYYDPPEFSNTSMVTNGTSVFATTPTLADPHKWIVYEDLSEETRNWISRKDLSGNVWAVKAGERKWVSTPLAPSRATTLPPVIISPFFGNDGPSEDARLARGTMRAGGLAQRLAEQERMGGMNG